MIDNFSLLVSHGLMLLAAWYLLRRPDLDREPPLDSVPETPRKDPFRAVKGRPRA